MTHNREHFELLHGSRLSSGRLHAGIVVASRRRDVYELARRLARLVDTVAADEMAGNILYL